LSVDDSNLSNSSLGEHTAQVDGLGLIGTKACNHPLLSSYRLSVLLKLLCHDYSAINIISHIVCYYCFYYYYYYYYSRTLFASEADAVTDEGAKQSDDAELKPVALESRYVDNETRDQRKARMVCVFVASVHHHH